MLIAIQGFLHSINQPINRKGFTLGQDIIINGTRQAFDIITGILCHLQWLYDIYSFIY